MIAIEVKEVIDDISALSFGQERVVNTQAVHQWISLLVWDDAEMLLRFLEIADVLLVLRLSSIN
jgi:hypothetical protein